MVNLTTLVVGGEGCPIGKIVSVLERGDSLAMFHNKWSHFARELETPSATIKKIRKDQFLEKISLNDALNELIEEWMARKGRDAHLQKLMSTLDIIGMTSCADNLRLEYNLPCSNVEENPSIKWEEVPPLFQRKIKEYAKKLFPDIPVQDILPKLTGTALVQLMTGVCPRLFKDTLPEPLSYYVNRTLLTRNLISDKILENNSPDIFLFTGLERLELSGLVKVMTGTSTEKLYGTTNARFLILDNLRHFDKFPESPYHSVHHLNLEGDGTLRWMKSKGSVSVIQKYVDESQDQLQEDELVETLSSSRVYNHPICISDSPGMGKSVLLAQIGRRLLKKKPDKIVIFVEIRELMQLIKKESEVTPEVIEKALQNLVCENELGEAVFKSSYFSDLNEQKLIELLLDGFDELGSYEMKLGYEILNLIRNSFKSIRLWVTSRSHLLHELENKLNVLGYNIQPFSHENQIQFFTSYWFNEEDGLDRNKLKEFAIECLKNVKGSMKSEDSDIAGIPLQCLLIGEIFAEEATDYSLTDSNSSFPDQVVIQSITHLYQRLIETKIRKYESLYTGAPAKTRNWFRNLRNVFKGVPPNESEKLTSAQLSDMHTLLSLNLLFPEKSTLMEDVFDSANVDEILKVGILERRGDAPSRFIHRTFAEYFAAVFAVDILNGNIRWDRVMADFVLHDILRCCKICVTLSSTGNTLISYKFRHDVIASFINYLIKDLRPVNNLIQISSVKSVDFADVHFQSVLEITHSCVQHDLPHIFYFFAAGQAFEGNGYRIFDTNFVLLAIRKSSLVEASLEHLKNYGLLDFSFQSSALLEAASKADFSTFEFLLKSGYLDRVVKSLSTSKSTPVLHYSVEESKDDSPRKIEQRIQIIRTLVRINTSLLEVRHCYRTPLIWNNVHVLLLIELICLGANVFARDEERLNILHCSANRTHLTNDDFNLLMKYIPDEKLKILLNQRNSAKMIPIDDLALRHDPAFDKFKLPGKYITGATVPLISAITNGSNGEMLQKLIELGGDVYWKWRKSATLLHVAAWYGNMDGIQLFIETYGIDVNIEDDDGLTPLNYILKCKPEKRWDVAAAIAGRGGRFGESTKNSEGLTCLHIAAKLHNLQHTMIILRLGVVDVNSVDNDGNTPLHLALREQWKIKIILFHMAKLLLDNGANPNAQNKYRQTPFHMALTNPDVDKQTLQLFSSKMDRANSIPNMEYPGVNEMDTKEHISITQIWANRIVSSSQLINFVISEEYHTNNDASHEHLESHISSYVERKYTLLHYIAMSENSEDGLKMIQVIKENFKFIITEDNGNRSFLHHYMTIAKPNPIQFHAIAKLLIDFYLVRLFNMRGGDTRTTPLMEAVLNVEIDGGTLFMLQESGVNFRMVDIDGNSVLTYATWGRRSKKFMQALMALFYIIGFIPRAFTPFMPLHSVKDDFDALIKAREDGETEDVNDIWKHTNLNTLLHIAIMDADLKALKVLVKKHGVVINSHDNYPQYTPLHRAALASNIDVALELMYVLLDNDADANVKDRRGCTFVDIFITASKPKPTPMQLHSLFQFLLERKYFTIFNINGGPRWFQIDRPKHASPNKYASASLAPTAGNEKIISQKELERRGHIPYWGPLSSELMNDYKTFLLIANTSPTIHHSTPLEKAVYTVELEKGTLTLLHSHGILNGIIPRLLNFARLGGRSEEYISMLWQYGSNHN